MVDLKGQYLKIKNEIDNALLNVIDSTAFINGPVVKDFQKDLEKYLNIKHVVPCGNGTDALQVSMMALGLQPGDEVITTGFTFIATVEVISLLGLIPVFVDIDPDTFNIDPCFIEKAITNKTKAIVPVHLFGQSANMEKIIKIAEKHSLYVIEDNAQALGAEYTFSNGTTKKTGTIGHIGCTSFFPSKNLGGYGDGGAIFTNNDNIAENLRSMVNHGMKVRYYYDQVGVNSRLDSLQAAILKIKLKHLDRYNMTRQKAADYYDDALKGQSILAIPFRYNKSTHIFNQYTLKTKNIDRNELIDFLKSKGIPAMIYYPVPLHLQKAYVNLDYVEGDLPVTEELCKTVFSIPMHTELEEEQQKYITDHIIEFIK